jgi:hypothetical protein
MTMKCPDCASELIGREIASPDRDIPPTSRPSSAIERLAVDDQLECKTICWDCGWIETRTLTLTATDETHGDPVSALEERVADLEADLATTTDRLETVRTQREESR